MSYLPAITLSSHVFPCSSQGLINKAVEFFDGVPTHKLNAKLPFQGAGVYALYHKGEFEPYAGLAKDKPIYVGKAVPDGWRKALVDNNKVTRALSKRLGEHAKSIQQASNLNLEDFECKFMVITTDDSDLIAPIESRLIRHYRPLWNTVVDGFGNHDPGSGRYDQACSEWDILHPGRHWTSRLTYPIPSPEPLLTKVNSWITSLDSEGESKKPIIISSVQ